MHGQSGRRSMFPAMRLFSLGSHFQILSCCNCVNIPYMAHRFPTSGLSAAHPAGLSTPLPRPSARRDWRGSLTLTTSSTLDRGNTPQPIKVIAAQTHGECMPETWPTHFSVNLSHQRGILPDVEAWVKQNAPPLCMFMPEKLGDGRSNDASFRSLSRVLVVNQTVAIAPWNAPDRLPGAGIIIYPTKASPALLVGAVFLTAPFPDCVTATHSSMPLRSQTPTPRSVRQHAHLPSHLAGPSMRSQTPMPHVSRSGSHSHSQSLSYSQANTQSYTGAAPADPSAYYSYPSATQSYMTPAPQQYAQYQTQEQQYGPYSPPLTYDSTASAESPYPSTPVTSASPWAGVKQESVDYQNYSATYPHSGGQFRYHTPR